MITDQAPEWDIEPNDFGGQIVHHRHPDVSAICYVYSISDRAWAACMECGDQLEVAGPMPQVVSTP
jgi:hypothetical protein